MESAPVPTPAVAAASAASPEQAGAVRAAGGTRIVARAVERLSGQRYLLAREGRVFLAQSATELPTGRDLRLILTRPGRPALLAPVAAGENGGLGSAQVSGRVRPAGSGQLLLSTGLGEELVRVSQGAGEGSVQAGQGRFRVLEPAEPALVRLQAELATQAAQGKPLPVATESGRSGLLASLLRRFLPVRQSTADVLAGTRQLLADARAARGTAAASAGGALTPGALERLLAGEVWRPEDGAVGLRAHLAAGGGRLGSRFLAQLLSGRPHSNAGFAAALAQ
ncbi:MAG: serine/threonine-protein kinase, partial [Planctomycetota bacterium]